jgi:hypothetical protein
VIGKWPLGSHAEEGASGHYQPGAMATVVDVLPGRECFIVESIFLNYNGSASASKSGSLTLGPRDGLEFGGQILANVDADIQAESLLFLYETPLKVFEGEYAAGAIVPYIWMDIKADAAVTLGPLGSTRRVHDTANGLGDIQLIPAMFVWKNEHDLKWGGLVSVYAPTGEYVRGQIANVGKNYWTVSPAAYISYVSTKFGLEATGFVGIDLNTTNEKTDYRTGKQLHFDGTIAQHLPLFGGFAGVGANGFYYKQITPDSGSGALLGSFESYTAGVGPLVNYTRKIGGVDAVIEVKWLPEMDVKRRLKGDFVWVKAAVVF